MSQKLMSFRVKHNIEVWNIDKIAKSEKCRLKL